MIIEREKLYSTGDYELDDLLEKAFCDGYEYAQREFGKKITSIRDLKKAADKVGELSYKRKIANDLAGTQLHGSFDKTNPHSTYRKLKDQSMKLLDNKLELKRRVRENSIRLNTEKLDENLSDRMHEVPKRFVRNRTGKLILNNKYLHDVKVAKTDAKNRGMKFKRLENGKLVFEK